MNILTAMRERLDRLSSCDELDVEAVSLPSSACRLSDASVRDLLAETAALANDISRLQSVLAGVAATRSTRDRGQGGFAATQGFGSPERFIQSITGGTRADAIRQVRVGRALLDEAATGTDAATPGGGAGAGAEVGVGAGAGAPPVAGAGDDAGVAPVAGAGDDAGVAPVAGVGDDAGAAPDAGAGVPPIAWHEPLRRAVLDGRLTTAQHDAIRRGLGEPRVATADFPTGGEVGAILREPGDEAAAATRDAMIVEAWMLAAEDLAAEAGSMPTEELAKRARTVRDVLDPIGAEDRYAYRFERRSIRTWVDPDGQHRSTIAWDDEMGLFVSAAVNAALRPRRGGPRFMTDEERAAADELATDPRSNEQLAYDLFVDLIRAGTLANAKDVFGSRQPGVRMVVAQASGPRDAFGRLLAVGHAEDGGCSLPGSVIDRNACTNGTIEVIVDPHGNPLDLGREARLYSGRQRLVLAVRDGGCVWPGCDRPPSYCEAHHIDPYAQGGATDVDRGVLLCRFHHLNLHHRGWRIMRDGKGPFLLHPPPGEGHPIVLTSRSAWKWAWDPPPPPTRAGWRIPPEPTRLPDVGTRLETTPAVAG